MERMAPASGRPAMLESHNGRARWGASGALFPQSAQAGLNSCPRPGVVRTASGRAASMVRSCAAETCEPRQVREEATVSSALWVPQGRRAGASQPGERGVRSGRRQVHGRFQEDSLGPCPHAVGDGISDAPSPMLVTPSDPRRSMRQLGIRPERRLSQSFLRRSSVARAMALAAEITPGRTVLEIGPGLGVLTAALLGRGARVIAVELDVTLAAALPSSLGFPEALTVVQADALSVDLSTFVTEPFTVVASLPYHVATPILFKLLLDRPCPDRVVVMVQEEVARRIAPRDLQHSYLEVAFSVFARARVVQRVAPESFFPVPKVWSAIVRFDIHPEPLIAPDAVRDFLAFVRSGFTQPRQQLHNSLGRGLGVAPSVARDIVDRAGLDSSLRPGALGLTEWKKLYRALGPRQESSSLS